MLACWCLSFDFWTFRVTCHTFDPFFPTTTRKLLFFKMKPGFHVSSCFQVLEVKHQLSQNLQKNHMTTMKWNRMNTQAFQNKTVLRCSRSQSFVRWQVWYEIKQKQFHILYWVQKEQEWSDIKSPRTAVVCQWCHECRTF